MLQIIFIIKALYFSLWYYDSELSTPTTRVMFLVSEICSYLDYEMEKPLTYHYLINPA